MVPHVCRFGRRGPRLPLRTLAPFAVRFLPWWSAYSVVYQSECGEYWWQARHCVIFH